MVPGLFADATYLYLQDLLKKISLIYITFILWQSANAHTPIYGGLDKTQFMMDSSGCMLPYGPW